MAILGRWEDVSQLVTTLSGQEIVSRSNTLLETTVSVGDYLYLGDETSSASPITVAEAVEVKDFKRVPRLRGRSDILQAFM